MGKAQTKLQIVALIILFASACVIENIITIDRPTMEHLIRTSSEVDDKKVPNFSRKVEEKEKLDKNKVVSTSHNLGVFSILLASFISGLAGAFSQRSLQSGISGHKLVGRNSYLFTMELSAASLILLLTSTFLSNDGKCLRKNGFFDGWTVLMITPIITNALGGILVGLVTKYAGAVKKGFSLIFGLLISGVIQLYLSDRGNDSGKNPSITKEQIIGGILAAVSLLLYSL